MYIGNYFPDRGRKLIYTRLHLFIAVYIGNYSPDRGQNQERRTTMSYLYITEDGAVLSVNGGYYTVTYRDGCVKNIPSETLESVSIFGNSSITTPCTRKLLENGIPVNYFSKRGAYYGRLESTRHTNIARLKSQIQMSDDSDFRIQFAQSVLSAKIRNQSVILRRYARNRKADVSEEIRYMNSSAEKILFCHETEELMGYEGTAARYYFQGLSKVVNSAFSFSGRNRMPPKDPFNSMLSLGYTLLMYEIYGEIENCGLNAYAGFIHADRERHPTLASDLMEEWRSVIVDSVVMSLVNGNEISTDDFVTDTETGGVFLTTTGMRIFITKLESKLRSETGYIESTYRMSFRGALWHQVSNLAKAVERHDPTIYTPVLIR